jgi:D-glycero-alpha-D-manno-heptose 1-phosphate guanylyltransferase
MTVIKQAIVLAGGLGTRLRGKVPELPKTLAPIAGLPFLAYLIEFFLSRGVYEFIFAVGYKKELILDYLKTLPSTIQWQVSVESEPLGTGGAIRKACRLAGYEHSLILNGDSFFALDPARLSIQHGNTGADCTLALKHMTHADRYGLVTLDSESRITSFVEKKAKATGLINGGIYALRVDALLSQSFPEQFSFEKDFLEKEFRGGKIFGQAQDGYFIDIGVPEDYERAQTELPEQIKKLHA